MCAAASFEAMPPLPTPERLAPAAPSRSRRRRVTSSINVADASRRGSAVKQSGGVGEQHEVRRAHQVGHERREPVVVPETDLLVGDGVVLVHDGDDAELRERLERAARVQVLAAVREVERSEQHLTDRHAHARRTRRARRASTGAGRPPRRPAGSRRRAGAAARRPRRPTRGDRARGHHDDATSPRRAARPRRRRPRPARRRRRRRASSVTEVVPILTTTLRLVIVARRRRVDRDARGARDASRGGARRGRARCPTSSRHHSKANVPTLTRSPRAPRRASAGGRRPSSRRRCTTSASAWSSVRSWKRAARLAARPSTRQACSPVALDRDLLGRRAVHHDLVRERSDLVATRARRPGGPGGPTRASRPSPVIAEIVSTPVELVGGDVALGADDDARTLEQVALVVAELAQRGPPAARRGGSGAASERSRSTQSTRARSTWRKKS